MQSYHVTLSGAPAIIANYFFDAPQVGPVLFILFARVGHDLRILPRNRQCDGPRLRKILRIFKRHGPLDVVIVHLLKSLDQMQLVAVLVARRVQPGPIVEPNRIHDERVPFPFANRISEPRRVHILRVAASVRVNDAESVLVFKKNREHGGVSTIWNGMMPAWIPRAGPIGRHLVNGSSISSSFANRAAPYGVKGG